MAISLYKINTDNLKFIMENYPEETDLINAIDFFTKAAQQNDYDIEEFNKAFETMEKTLDSKEFKDLAEQIQNDPECNKTEAFNRCREIGLNDLHDARIAYTNSQDKVKEELKGNSRVFTQKTSMEMAADYIKQAALDTVQKIADSINHARKAVDNTVKNAVNTLKQGGHNMMVATKQMCLNSVKYAVKAAGNLEHKMNAGIRAATQTVKDTTKAITDSVKEAPVNAQKARLHMLNGIDKCVIQAQKNLRTYNVYNYKYNATFEQDMRNIAKTTITFSKGVRAGLHHISDQFNEKIINHRWKADITNSRFNDEISDIINEGMKNGRDISYKDAYKQAVQNFTEARSDAMSQLHPDPSVAKDGPMPSKLAQKIANSINKDMDIFHAVEVVPFEKAIKDADKDIANRENNIDTRDKMIEGIEDIEQGK